MEWCATPSRVLEEVVMIAEITFLPVFFALGTLLIFTTHRNLVADEACCIAKPERAPAIRDASMRTTWRVGDMTPSRRH
jgi:hypothetical protein